jgi:hypothetical protein
MEKEFVPYEESLELKELGFDEPCLGVYYESKTFYIYTKSKGVKNSDKTSQSWVFTAPLYQQAFKFFREKKIQSTIQEYDFNNYMYLIDDGINRDIEVMGYNSYEEAEIECLKKLIEIVKEKK